MSNLIYFEDAEIEAISRVIYVLQEKLQETLFEIAEPNLYLPAPADDAYYMVKQDPAQVTANHPVTIIVYPVTEVEFVEGQTGGRLRTSSREGSKSLVRWQVGTTLLFRRGLYDVENRPVEVGGRTLNAREHEQLRVFRYKAALIKTLTKHLVSKPVISRADPIGNSGDLVVIGSDEEYFGYATGVIEVQQDVVVPSSSHTI